MQTLHPLCISSPSFSSHHHVFLSCVIPTCDSFSFASITCLKQTFAEALPNSIFSTMKSFFLLHVLLAASLVGTQSVADLPSCSVRFPIPDTGATAALTWTCSFPASLLLLQQPVVATQTTFANVHRPMLLPLSLR